MTAEQERRAEALGLPTAERTTVLGIWTPETADRGRRREPKGPSDAALGARIGPYRTWRAIGQGGMGTVYLASRADNEDRRRVAIKVLRSELDGAAVRRRFRSERQILANLDHPNIARLLEGGTTDDGRPYFAMEYVDGIPIDRFCDQRQLSIGERLELFCKVAETVHYAHQNLVVHRDIKPRNILVTAGGIPKLLDFGIAKVLDPASFPYSLELTLSGSQPMTPNYASPEQLLGREITTVSDVFSLGVLLYRLLTGLLPFQRGLRELLSDVEGMLAAERPLAPSAAVTALPSELRRRLAGDLDDVVLMALRPEPERRQGSAEQLAGELRRHMQGLPVATRATGVVRSEPGAALPDRERRQ